VANLELPRDLRHINMPALEGERSVTRRDPERRSLGEVGNDVFARALELMSWSLIRSVTEIGLTQECCKSVVLIKSHA
jgi:hypothetical protein